MLEKVQSIVIYRSEKWVSNSRLKNSPASGQWHWLHRKKEGCTELFARIKEYIES